MTGLVAKWCAGLPDAINHVTMTAPATHRFLRREWFAAAAATHGDRARTLLVERAEKPVLALPLVLLGRPQFGILQIPGCYWPFRSFVLADGDREAATVAVKSLFQSCRALRIGPVYEDDSSLRAITAAAASAGCAVLARPSSANWTLELGAQYRTGEFPRASTQKRTRYYEKQLAKIGELTWHVLSGADWPANFALLGEIEEQSWITEHTDGCDAKFTGDGHLAFWQAAALDPILRDIMHATLLKVGGVPAAFSFNLRVGETSYVIANSYDARFARHSPGKVVISRNLVEMARNGVETVDWGSGDSGYKQEFGARRGKSLVDLVIIRNGLCSFMVRAMLRLTGDSTTWRTYQYRSNQVID